MKNYELITELSKLPAGAKVEINALKSLEEMPKAEDGLRRVNFSVKEAYMGDDGIICLDGWSD
jgi:hypothetical protein